MSGNVTIANVKKNQHGSMVTVEGIARGSTIDTYPSPEPVERLLFYLQQGKQILNVYVDRKQLKSHGGVYDSFGDLECMLKSSSESELPVTVEGKIYKVGFPPLRPAVVQAYYIWFQDVKYNLAPS